MAQDPYRYFRLEARELLEQLGRGVLELEQGADPELVARLLRFAHTLKGAARVVKQLRMAEVTHALEELLLARREANAAATPDELRALLALVDQLAELLRALDVPTAEPAVTGPKPEAAKPARPRDEDAFESVRVDVEEVDALLRSVTEASVRAAALSRELSRFERISSWVAVLRDQLSVRRERDVLASQAALARARALVSDMATEVEALRDGAASGIERLQSEIHLVREAAQQLRLVPVRALFPGLERVAHDAAQQLGKQVRLVPVGGDVRLEAHVLASLREALSHVVRNAVTHGIETASQRAAAGKPSVGTIELRVERRGSRALFGCRDDGRGVDFESARRALVEKGMLGREAAAALSAQEVIEQLQRSGVSTSKDVSELSGRGIGLDVVSEVAKSLKGSVLIESQQGLGTRVVVEVPVSLALIEALRVEVSGEVMAIPIDSVREVLGAEARDLSRTQGRLSLLHAGEALPFLPLEQLFGARSTRAGQRGKFVAVVIRTPDAVAVVGVDRVLGTTALVMRALPAVAEAEALVAGAALDAEGNPELVLDPRGLIERCLSYEGSASAEETRPERLPILVVDDSLTTRMLEQSILESAGYHVELAVSAEEALLKARANRYGLFIVDVEMPGMNGFEFVTATRNDAQLGQIPAILVTSLDTAEDRRRGQEAGASAYIVKGEFDQGLLLRTIAGLLG